MKLIVANWKLYLGVKEAARFATRIHTSVPRPAAEVVLCPSAPALAVVGAALGKSPYALGAQDVGVASRGPYTGELSGRDLRELGCAHVIVGHSERRRLGESDALVHQKLEAAFAAGLKPILCVGETKSERRAGKAKSAVRRQLTAAFKNLRIMHYALRITIAYEPVWAIGTGTPATPGAVVAMHKFVRAEAKKLFRSGMGFRILYGGSVDQKNIISFLCEPEVDGVLVGGASARPSFIDILKLVG